MTILSSGQRIPLTQLLSTTTLQLGIGMQAPPGMVFDVSCFGVDQNDQLSDDRYFIFYNQTRSPENAMTLLGPQQEDLQRFQIELHRLPATIKKLVCTISMEGPGAMSHIESGYLRLLDDKTEVARFSFSGQHFTQEKAIIIAEIYLKESWRLLALGQGFSGGLSALLKHYGGEEQPDTPPISAPIPVINLSKGIQLEKKVLEKAPHLVNLVKKINVILEKKQIQNVIAKVVMVMDASGSMVRSYLNGTVQAVVDRLSVVAMRIDDDGSLEAWFYASDFQQTPDITLDNLHNYVKNHGRPGGGNNEPAVMEILTKQHQSSTLPVLVIFVTDGGISKKNEIVRLLQHASHYPIFWQFIGVAGNHYGVLEELDTCPGRVVDNANFFAIDDLSTISDDQLFERMLTEFPVWLRAVKQQGILR